MAGIQAQAARQEDRVVMNPVAASNVPAVVKTITANGGYMVVWWNMPPGTEPKTSGDHFVAFGTYNGITAGECGAERLVQALHGETSLLCKACSTAR